MSFELLQQPQLSTSIQVLQSLSSRSKLSSQEKHQLHNRLKGFAGEKVFAEFLHEQKKSYRLTLYNLRLATNDTEFEMDCLVMQDDMLYLFEVKNYEGDFLYEDGQWFIVHNKKEINDPLAQLKRSEILLKQTLHRLKLNIPVRGYVVFVHPNFQLYHAPLSKNIIYPAQLERFAKRFNKNAMPCQRKHQELMHKLATVHIADSSRTRMPIYDFESLRKGVFCQKCKCYVHQEKRGTLRCNNCDGKESTTEALLRMTREFTMLFPDEKITTKIIYIWCGKTISMKIIRRILQKHLRMIGNNRGTYFIFPNK